MDEIQPEIKYSHRLLSHNLCMNRKFFRSNNIHIYIYVYPYELKSIRYRCWGGVKEKQIRKNSKFLLYLS